MQQDPLESQHLASFVRINSKHKKVEIFPTFNDSFLLCKWLTQPWPFRHSFPDQIQHYSLPKKKVIFQTYLGKLTFFFRSSKNTHIIILNVNKHKIQMFNLQTGKHSSVKQQFSPEAVMKCMLFYESQIFCVFQVYRQKKEVKLYFYSESKLIQEKGPIYQTTIKMNIPSKYITSHRLFAKLNQFSKLSYFSEEKGEIYIKTLELEFNASRTKILKEHHEHFILDIGLSEYLDEKDPDDLNQIEMIRQIDKNQFLLTVKDFNRSNILFQGMFQQCQHFCILDISDKLYSKIVPLKITDHHNHAYDLSDMKYLFVQGKNLFVFQKYSSFKKNIVIIDMKKRQVVGEIERMQGNWNTCSGLKDGRMLVEYNSDQQKGVITIKMTDYQISSIKIAFAHLLLSLNQDFDDDLVTDSIDLLFD